MASPFRTFRKNQKAWMVGLTIMTMFAFVFLGQVAGNRSSSSGEYKDPEVFTWKYGSVHKSEIEQRLRLRRMINQFLAQAALKAGQSPQIVMMLQQNQIFRPVEKEVVDTMLLDKKAQQLGIVVNDRMVNDFIHAVAPGLSGQDLANILRGMSYGLGQAQLFDAIRDELAARYVDQTFGQMLGRSNGQYAWFNGDTPADRWEYFSRLNRKVTAEILPVSVDKFVGEIPDPSADELRKFYDLYKNDYPDPSRPTPGFKRPFRAQFQYVKADYDKKLKEEMGKVTDEEIAEYYEKNKDDFKKSKLPDLPERPLDVPLPENGKSAAEENSPDKKSDAKSDAKASETKADAATSEAKSGDTKSGSKAPEDRSADSKAGAAKSASGKSDAKGAAPKSGDSKKSGDAKGDAKKSSLNRPASLHGEQLAMADDAAMLLAQASSTPTKSNPKAPGKTDAAKTGAAKTDAANKADSAAAKSSKSDSAADKTNDTAAQKETAAKNGEKGTQSKDATPADGKAADAKPADEKAASATEQPVEYKSLEEVKETIRERIADKRIHDKRIAAFSSIKQLMSNYRRDRENYDSKIKQGMSAKKPEAPTPEFLADAKYDAGLDGHTTELVSPSEIQSAELGRSYRGPTSQNYSTTPFLRIAFQEPSKNSRGLPLYQVDESQDNDQNQYLWWKIDEKPAEVPKLEDIKDEVVQAWKMIQARKPAKAKAEADAELARKEKKSLKELFTDSQKGEVSTAGPFSWYSRLPAQLYESLPRITLTKVSGVEQGGDDFLKAVFALKERQTGVAANQPETVYYVVRIESEEPGLDKLHDEFLADMSNPMAAQVYAVVGASENAGQGLAWLNELKEEFGFKLAPGQTLSEAATFE
jgi:hypothetical protein